MSRKRRVFDIDIPEGDAPEPRVSSLDGVSRRGPMASAISENAGAVRARAEAQQAIRDENDALAHEFVALRDAGAVVQEIPLDDIRAEMLVRDRLPGDDEELRELVTSIRDTGLSNPIRVIARPDGGFELVQGFRRLSAYRELNADGGTGWSRIPALIMSGSNDAAGLYRRMVDENVIRKGLSFAEMAHAAQVYAADPSTEAVSTKEAVAELFKSAAYSKRSYIRDFALLLEQLGEVLLAPTRIPRALGVSLAQRLKEAPDLAKEIKVELMAVSSDEAQMEILRRIVGRDGRLSSVSDPERTSSGGVRKAKTKTTFHLQSSAGQVKCTAGPGRLEIKVDRDFTSIDRARLEAAIAGLVDDLG